MRDLDSSAQLTKSVHWGHQPFLPPVAKVRGGSAAEVNLAADVRAILAYHLLRKERGC